MVRPDGPVGLGRPDSQAYQGAAATQSSNSTATGTSPSPPARSFVRVDRLNLYLMGLAKPEEVPDFFILRNLMLSAKRDADGHPIYTGTRTNITIKDVIAAMGPREPDFDHAQKAFNTAMVVMTMTGKKPTPELLAAANTIGEHWITYWSKVTRGRSRMTTIPK